jgi:DNA-binding NarL/FixJ family response regulator
MIRIVLADDHAVLRAGLRLLIDAQPDMSCVGEAGDGLETLARVEALQPDLVLLDLSMPHLGGLVALPEIRRRAPRARVLVLTMHADEEYLRQALQAGAAGYVPKQAADQELLSAIRAVLRGGVYIHPTMARALLGSMLDELSPALAPSATLSEREMEVIVQVARGRTNREVAERLSLSIKTVETYRARAMEKLGLSSRAALVRYAQAQGWLNE